MYSYFEDVFKCAFLKSVVHTHKEIAESLSSISDKDVTMELSEISILLDSTPESIYSQKSKALKKLRIALKDEKI